jgi:tRNA (guanine-N7-)-methyltransferase
MPNPPLRKIRSFVRRPGRATAAQRKALASLMPRYGVPFTEQPLDCAALFGREAPRVLDIGFGDGEALLSAAVNRPDVDYLGVEVHEPGIGHLLLLLERADVHNVRVIERDVVEVIEHMLTERAFDAVNLFFPDPWPKKRHHKRRLVQPEFVRRLATVLRPGGLFHVATDWAGYAEHVAEVMRQSPQFAQIGDPTAEALALRAPTKFERRGRTLGHDVHDLYYRRNATDGA